MRPPGAASSRFATIIAAITALAVATPVLSIAMLALAPSDDLWPHLFHYVLPRAIQDTAALMAGVGTVALILGAGTAWLVSCYDFIGRRALLWLMPLPLAIPTYIVAYVYVDLFEPLGAAHRVLQLWLPPQDSVGWLPNLRSLPGAILLIGVVLYPYVYLSARTALQYHSAEFIEAAKTLGARRWQIFWLVALPMARPALALGLALVCLETLNDIGASEYLGVQTLTVAVFTTWLNRGSLAGAAQISCLMLAVVALLIAIERYGRRNVSVEFSAENPQHTTRIHLSGIKAWSAFGACLAPVVFGFVIPLLFLIFETIKRGLLTAADDALMQHVVSTVVYAALATLVSLLLGLAAILAHRWHSSAPRAAMINVAQAGYALPGLVLAIGLLIPVLAIDNGLNALARWLALPAPGLLIVGSGAALVLAYVIRFLAVPVGLLKAGAERIPRDYDDSADAAGAGRMTSMRRIHLPLLRPAMVGAAIVVFVDCLKELPATLLLRPLNVETLATSIYQYASRGSFEDGALAALLIVAASIGPVAWLTRFSDLPSGPA
ncbi:MAG: iron ABC transporter permease [Xanthobacteraceae bacterium]